ncbi:nitrate reductase [Xylaria bambusicola]|uniref:nitrate reductase n=1 Tax=Xylaria bambusicola TaxID=326684 RepID=UPI002008B5B2|nr:nitrate reductase [Xylaria bambusicola]KAI0505548.1 nitrate reductase [Xylaria bambusicola]
MDASRAESSDLPSKAQLSGHQHFPPTPPDTDRESTDSSLEPSDTETGASSSSNGNNSNVLKLPLYPLPPRSKPDNTVLAEDLKTPDNHVIRDPRLIRLTGIHPFNVEAPLSNLYDEGFLTTKDLHYVRNHGAVPRVEDSEIVDWEFTIEGMVDNPIRMSLADLMRDYEQQTYPITLVCAGNRRKEQNIVRKTKGFSWGAAGLSTSLWTGVAIGDLLKAAMPQRGARYVCFEGADKLPNGYYGTSIKLSWALDAERGVMLAHKMNGETLPPDHGKPLRVVIPGQIGGRSVKWLKRIIVTKEPSSNWYHIYDNRVLPTMIDPEMSADLPETWKDERYAIYDLNTNSATCYPGHNEILDLHGSQSTYNVRGYAYAGGGKRISRVEVTLDKGKTWILANITYPEDQYRLATEGETLYGGRIDISWRESCFCWCFWNLDIPISQLQAADDIMVRAMDEAMMVQPRDMYWSVLGMMNNPWFRVVILKERHCLRFEHPTQPALMPGGWMERVKKTGGDLTNGYWGEHLAGESEVITITEPAKEICMTNEEIKRTISLEEFKAHDGEEEPWFVVNGEVYNGTSFLEGHPGGPTSITGAAGQDASEEFLAIHSENAKAMLVDYHIGTLDKASQALLANNEEVPPEDAPPRAVFLQHKMWSKAILSAKRSVSPDTKIFTFDLDHANQEVGLPVGQHLTMRLRDPVTREAILRAYTPISPTGAKGKLDVLVKIYRDAPTQKGGRMTQALDSIPLGHFVDFKGPHGKFEYLGRGVCRISGRERRVRRFIMVCGGSGITPIYAVLRAVLTDREDPTCCVVLNGNRNEKDILCRADLDAMIAGNEHRYRLNYVLSRPDPAWTGRRGRVDADLIAKEVGPCTSTDGGDLVLVCGPKPLEESVLSIFTGMGWDKDDMLFF